MTTRITTDNITDATIGTADLASSVPLNTQWQAVKTGDFTAVAGEGYFVDTTSAAVEVTLPASPSAGDVVVLKDYARTWGTNAVTIASALFDEATRTQSFSTNGKTVTLVYMDGTKGWSLINEDTTTGLGAQFLSATGGTITTSGDYTIHTFTGDGCFVVSTLGNGPTVPVGGPNAVDYLVVAGGGGGGYAGSGGGGAGGFRVSNTTCMPGPQTSPLSSPTGITVTATTYPVTVGSGGSPTSSTPVFGGKGSNSVFSTITSAGGGGGAPNNPALNPSSDKNGGSGGGAGELNNVTAGSGNTPPTSPSQGNNGGGAPLNHSGGGGGGAGAVGVNNSGPDSACSVAGTGGAGSFVLGTGFAGCNGEAGPVSGTRYFAGGGGGGHNAAGPNGGPGGSGGVGGGGDGTEKYSGNVPTKNGITNTGGGGGGGGPNTPSPSGSGGSGIVIIRYKSS